MASTERTAYEQGRLLTLAVAATLVGVTLLLILLRTLSGQAVEVGHITRLVINCCLAFGLCLGVNWVRWITLLLLFVGAIVALFATAHFGLGQLQAALLMLNLAIAYLACVGVLLLSKSVHEYFGT